jgi:hypothetical protein
MPYSNTMRNPKNQRFKSASWRKDAVKHIKSKAPRYGSFYSNVMHNYRHAAPYKVGWVAPDAPVGKARAAQNRWRKKFWKLYGAPWKPGQMPAGLNKRTVVLTKPTTAHVVHPVHPVRHYLHTRETVPGSHSALRKRAHIKYMMDNLYHKTMPGGRPDWTWNPVLMKKRR